MDQKLSESIYNQAKKWVLDAGVHIRSKMYDPLVVETKSNPNDLVTTLDKETESFFVKKIKNSYPDHFIIGEEGHGDKLTSLNGTVWIIDPIDGTMNFVHQKRNFAISIGIYHDGIGEIGLIYDVMSDVLYHAKRGEGAFKNDYKLPELKQDIKVEEAVIALNHYWLCPNKLVNEKKMQQFIQHIRGARTIGSAALEFAYAAEGSLDGYLSISLMPWDVAAGIVILREVGGVATNIDGKPLDLLGKDSLLACNAAIQTDMLGFLNEARQ